MWILLQLLILCTLSSQKIHRSYKPKLGESCFSHEQCRSYTNATCFMGFCRCFDGHVQKNSRCYPLVNKGEKCEISEQCLLISTGECVNNTCVAVNENATKLSKRAARCRSNKECPKKFSCKYRTCVKRIGRDFDYVDDDNEPFVRVLGVKCTSNATCKSVFGSACIKHICDCLPNFVQKKERTCIRKADRLGDACENTYQCMDIGGECIERKCVPKFIPDTPSFIVPSKSLGQFCHSDRECEYVLNAYCNRICMCRDHFISPVSQPVCLPKATSYNLHCAVQVQCIDLTGTNCVNSLCLQPNETVNIGVMAGGSEPGISHIVTFVILIIVFFI